MRTLTLRLPIPFPKSASDWAMFQQMAQAQFREAKSRPYGEVDGRVGLGFTVSTMRLIDNSQVPTLLRRIIRRLHAAKILKTFDVRCIGGEVIPGPELINIVLSEEGA